MVLIKILKRALMYIVTGVPIVHVNARIVTLPPSDILLGKNVLVTGGSSGIGKAIAESFLKAGASVIITGRNKDKLDACVEELREFTRTGTCINGLVMNNSDVSSIKKNVIAAEAFIGGKCFDVLVNNAGILGNASFNCNEQEYDCIFDTNLKGTFFLSQEISKRMIKHHVHGNILNIASSSSLRPATNPYTLSKWGIRAFTLGLAKKLVRHNIVVNGIAPGPNATAMMKTGIMHDIGLPNNPSKRYGTPEEIANMAVFLVSDMGRLVVGDIVYMTGGSGIITYDDI